jgi:hypothetical protein
MDSRKRKSESQGISGNNSPPTKRHSNQAKSHFRSIAIHSRVHKKFNQSHFLKKQNKNHTPHQQHFSQQKQPLPNSSNQNKNYFQEPTQNELKGSKTKNNTENIVKSGYYFNPELNRYFKIPKPGTPFYKNYLEVLSKNKNPLSTTSTTSTTLANSKSNSIQKSTSKNVFLTVLKRERDSHLSQLTKQCAVNLNVKRLVKYNTFPTQTSGTECSDLRVNPHGTFLVAGMKNGVVTFVVKLSLKTCYFHV